MIRLRKIDHVCLRRRRRRRRDAGATRCSSGSRCATRPPTARRWRATTSRTRSSWCAPTTTPSSASPTARGSCGARVSLDDARAHLREAGRGLRRSRRRARRRRSRGLRAPPLRVRARRRPAPGDRAPDDDAAGSAAAQARAHQPAHRRHGGRDRVLHRRARHGGLRLPRRRRHVAALHAEHHQVALVDAGRAHFHHFALDYYDFGTLRACSTASPSTAAGCRGARCGTASPRTSAATCGSPRSRCMVECYVDMELLEPRARAAPLARRPLLVQHVGAAAARARTSASTPPRSSPNARAARRRGIPLPPLQEV